MWPGLPKVETLSCFHAFRSVESSWKWTCNFTDAAQVNSELKRHCEGGEKRWTKSCKKPSCCQLDGLEVWYLNITLWKATETIPREEGITVAFHSIQWSHVTGLSQMLKCNGCHRDFGQVLESFRKSKKNIKKGLKIPKKIIRSLFRSVYIYLVKFWTQPFFIIILWDICTGGAPPCQTPVYISKYVLYCFQCYVLWQNLSVLYPCWQGLCSHSNIARQRNSSQASGRKKSWCHDVFQRLLKSKFWQPCHASRGLSNWTKCYSNLENCIQVLEYTLINAPSSPCFAFAFPSITRRVMAFSLCWFERDHLTPQRVQRISNFCMSTIRRMGLSAASREFLIWNI